MRATSNQLWKYQDQILQSIYWYTSCSALNNKYCGQYSTKEAFFHIGQKCGKCVYQNRCATANRLECIWLAAFLCTDICVAIHNFAKVSWCNRINLVMSINIPQRQRSAEATKKTRVNSITLLENIMSRSISICALSIFPKCFLSHCAHLALWQPKDKISVSRYLIHIYAWL